MKKATQVYTVSVIIADHTWPWLSRVMPHHSVDKCRQSYLTRVWVARQMWQPRVLPYAAAERLWVLWKGAGSEWASFRNRESCLMLLVSEKPLSSNCLLMGFSLPQSTHEHLQELAFLNWKALFWKLKRLPAGLWLLRVQSFLFVKLECTALKLLGSWILIRVLDLGKWGP